MDQVCLKVFMKKYFVMNGTRTAFRTQDSAESKSFHEGIDMGIGFVPDIIIDNKLILELKSVECLADVHYKQLLTYLRLNKIETRTVD